MEQKKLPNALAVLILGILSIVTCCCGGLFGLVFGVIALILANKDMKLYRENPESYSNYNNLNTGKILAIIGIVLSVVTMVYMVIQINAMGGWDNYMESIRVAVEEAQRQQQQ